MTRGGDHIHGGDDDDATQRDRGNSLTTPPNDPTGATLEAAAASDESLDRRIDEIDSAVAFRRAFRNAKLSEDDRILLNLLFGQELTVKEAAARMGIGHGVARKRKSRLLLRLRGQL